MCKSVETNDAVLSRAVTALSETRSNYWSFTGKARRSYCHNYFQYPAMMVPEIGSVPVFHRDLNVVSILPCTTASSNQRAVIVFTCV